MGNHSTEAMGETGLFSIAQVRFRHTLACKYSFFKTNSLSLQAILMTKGLMERSLHHKTALGRVREKTKLAKEEPFELRNLKLVMEQKLKLAE